MSDPTPARALRAFLAPLALAVLFGSGLLLAYSVDPPRRNAPTEPRTAQEPAATPAPQGVHGGESGTDDARLAEAQQRIQGLEQAIDALEASQAAALDKAREEAGETVAELQRQLREALAQAARSAPKSRSLAEQLGRDYAALGACYSERGILVTLGDSDLRFAPGQGSLSNPAPMALDTLAELMKRDSGLRALVEGHTDSQGNAEKNLALSNQRAESVRQALIRRGVEPERVQAEGLGEANPVATNASEAGRSRNRRVEIRLSESPSEV